MYLCKTTESFCLQNLKEKVTRVRSIENFHSMWHEWMSKRPVKDIVKDDVRASRVLAQWKECGQNAGLVLWPGFSGFLGNPAQRLCHAVIWSCRRLGCGFRIKWMNPNTKSTLKLMPSQLEPRQLLTSQPVSHWGICGVVWFCSKKKKEVLILWLKQQIFPILREEPIFRPSQCFKHFLHLTQEKCGEPLLPLWLYHATSVKSTYSVHCPSSCWTYFRVYWGQFLPSESLQSQNGFVWLAVTGAFLHLV